MKNNQFEDQESCPKCGKFMEFTGQPDLAGPVSCRFYRCIEHGIIRVELDRINQKEDKEKK